MKNVFILIVFYIFFSVSTNAEDSNYLIAGTGWLTSSEDGKKTIVLFERSTNSEYEGSLKYMTTHMLFEKSNEKLEMKDIWDAMGFKIVNGGDEERWNLVADSISLSFFKEKHCILKLQSPESFIGSCIEKNGGPIKIVGKLIN